MRTRLSILMMVIMPLVAGAEVYVPLIWPTARVAGVAGAATALSDGIETALWNPAGFGALRGIAPTLGLLT